MRPRSSVKGSTRPPSQSTCTPRETRERLLRRRGPAWRLQGLGDRPPQWPGSGPRLVAFSRLPGRPRAGESLSRSRTGAPDRRDHRRRGGCPRSSGQVPQGHRPIELHRISQSDRAQDLGQLALPAHFRRATDNGMVAAEAAWMGMRQDSRSRPDEGLAGCTPGTDPGRRSRYSNHLWIETWLAAESLTNVDSGPANEPRGTVLSNCNGLDLQGEMLT